MQNEQTNEAFPVGTPSALKWNQCFEQVVDRLLSCREKEQTGINSRERFRNRGSIPSEAYGPTLSENFTPYYSRSISNCTQKSSDILSSPAGSVLSRKKSQDTLQGLIGVLVYKPIFNKPRIFFCLSSTVVQWHTIVVFVAHLARRQGLPLQVWRTHE